MSAKDPQQFDLERMTDKELDTFFSYSSASSGFG
jgi:hypothetical protein